MGEVCRCENEDLTLSIKVIPDANAKDFSLKTRRKFIEKVKRKRHEVESYLTQRREESFPQNNYKVLSN